MRLRIDPRIRGRALQKDSYKASDEFIKGIPRVINVTQSEKKLEQPVPRLNETKLNKTEEKDENIRHLEILRGKHEPENLSENYQFRLENGRNKHLSQRNAVVQKASAKPNRNSTSWPNPQSSRQ